MYSGHVERILAAADAEEAGTLLKCLRTEFGHFEKGAPICKCTVLLSVCHNVFRYRLVDAGDVGQESGGGGVHVNADAVHAVLDDSGQRL